MIVPAATRSVRTWTRVTDGQSAPGLVTVVSILLALPSRLNTYSLNCMSFTRHG